MILLIPFLMFSGIFQDEIPYKAKDEFEIKFHVEFKQRGVPDDVKRLRFEETVAERNKRISNTPLPYVSLFVKIIAAKPEAVRLKVVMDDFTTVMRSKVEPGMEFKLMLGYTDDLKDHVSGYKHVIQFLSEKRSFESYRD